MLKQKYPDISLISTWRPQEYQGHIRSIWDAYRFVDGKTVAVPSGPGFNCSNPGAVIQPPSGWQNCSAEFKNNVKNVETPRHSSDGPTRPACISDHVQGIALDITVSTVSLRQLVQYAESLSGDLALCHYIGSDAPHFGLKKYLPTGIPCSQGI